jgi:hypothetical protein
MAGFDDLAALLQADPALAPQMAPQGGSINDIAAAYAQQVASNGPPLDTGNAAVPTGPVDIPMEQLGVAPISGRDAAGKPVAPPIQLAGAGTSQSSSASASAQGMNTGLFDNLQNGKPAKGYYGQVERAKQARVAEGKAMADNAGTAFDAQEEAAREQARVAGAIAQEKAGDSEAAKTAVNEAGEALGLDPITTTGAAQRAIAQASVIAKEQEEAAKAQFKAEQARAEYTVALNRVKSTVINPNRLVANQPLAFGLQNVVASIAMISGKPGMTNFANMLNDGMMKAMQRDVDAQLNKLEQNKAVAAGFKNVYDMVVSENDTAAQARSKMYGAYLASMEGYIESQMGQHDSEAINANLASTLAGIKSQRVEVENKYYTDALERGLKDAQMITQKYASDQSASVQRAQIAESRAARAQAAKDKADEAKKEAAKQAAGVAIISPITNEHQGQVKYADPKEAQKVAQDINEKQGKAAVVLRSLDRIEQLNQALTTGELVGKDALGAKDAIVKELETIKQLTASDMANVAGLKPLSDTDLKQMREAVGTESLKDNLFASIIGGDSSSIGSTEATRDYMVRNMDNAFKVHLRQANPEEAGAVAQTYGEGVLYRGGDSISVPIPTANPGQFVMAPQNPAPGFAPYGPDYTEYSPQVSPGDTALAEGHKNPKVPTEVEKTRDMAAEYKPQDEVLTPVAKADAPPFMVEFAKDMEKSGRGKTDAGKNFDDELLGNDVLNVPHFADDIAKVAHMAFYDDNGKRRKEADADVVSVLADLAQRTDDIGDLAEWALKNPDRFDLDSIGSIVGKVKR